MRGLNDPSKVVEVRKFLSNNKTSVAALLETKVKHHNSSRIQKKFGSNWAWDNNYVCSPWGIIWLSWLHNEISIRILDKTEYLIHCLV